MTFVRSFLILAALLIATPAMADPCPGFEAAISAVEAALPPVPAPVILTPLHG